ncbi:hypothetical protein HOO68_05345 [Candidatus Gracilibacteria bacterium]|nr:hypothetical protein [Candidatus Gracilibacteria bacterium]
MENINTLFLFLLITIVALLSKYIYWKYTSRDISYKHILLDLVYFIFVWIYMPYITLLLLDNINYSGVEEVIAIGSPEAFSYYVVQSIFILAILFPIFVSLLYGYIYKKYFHQNNPYFSFQILIFFLVVPILTMLIFELVKYSLRFIS